MGRENPDRAHANMAKTVNALVLGTSEEILGGSSPSIRTLGVCSSVGRASGF